MSVYTSLDRGELSEFLQRYRVGVLIDHTGIADGIENTNYFVTTDMGRYVLTVFEQSPAEELTFCLELMAYLAKQSIPCAKPQADKNREYLQTIRGKPAALVRRLNGTSVSTPSLAHCRAIGTGLGRMHQAASQFGYSRENQRGHAWHVHTAAKLTSWLDETDARLLTEELEYRRNHKLSSLPSGVLHADLFRDNALFVGHTLTGLIDFYHAYTGPLIYDLAVTVSDWCFCPQEHFDLAAARSLVDAYSNEREVSQPEKDAWVICMRATGLRFWLSRMHDLRFPRDGTITHTKDPNTFRHLLHVCRERSEMLTSVWR